jgi:hypothetical protein
VEYLCYIVIDFGIGLCRLPSISYLFQAHYYPQTITETVLFEAAPEIRVSKQKNVLERLWAYLTIQDLLRRVARFENLT